jgi:hypothetical protein
MPGSRVARVIQTVSASSGRLRLLARPIASASNAGRWRVSATK